MRAHYGCPGASLIKATTTLSPRGREATIDYGDYRFVFMRIWTLLAFYRRFRIYDAMSWLLYSQFARAAFTSLMPILSRVACCRCRVRGCRHDGSMA